MNSSIAGKVRNQVWEFYNQNITLATLQESQLVSGNRGDRYQKRQLYEFNQANQISLNDFAYNSKFITGKYDNEYNRKIFINRVKFQADVGTMQIDIDSSNFLFVPTSANHWIPWLMGKDFHLWNRKGRANQIKSFR